MGGTVTFRVGADAAGARLDKYLAAQPGVGSRSRARQAIDSGKVSVDGLTIGSADAGRALSEGEIVEVAWDRPGTNARRTKGRSGLDVAGVSVLYEDAWMVVVDKPAGLLTDAATRQQHRDRDTLRKRVRTYAGAQVFPVHRIDRDTTGVVAFARDERSRDTLRAQWHARTPERVYLAVAEGQVSGEGGRWADWMAWDPRGRIQRSCRIGDESGVLAEAEWRVVERLGRRATLLEVRLVTGRRNQIRLHAQLAGHPLVGDRQYGARDASIRYDGQALHARRLSVDHPRDGRRLTFEAPVPPALERLVRFLRG